MHPPGSGVKFGVDWGNHHMFFTIYKLNHVLAKKLPCRTFCDTYGITITKTVKISSVSKKLFSKGISPSYFVRFIQKEFLMYVYLMDLAAPFDLP